MTTDGYTNGYPNLPGLSGDPRGIIPELFKGSTPSDLEHVRTLLRPGIATWCEKTLAGISRDPPERNAMNNFARAMNIIGADVELNINMVLTRELGIGLQEARRKLSMVASIEGVDYDGAVSIMEGEVRAWYAQRGKRMVIVDDNEAVAP